ncbi:hypothetical protein RJ55_07758 [Drechmeria coniospora]|nr:hypothetical protein RJ55_07758 [Drechmeria coniospora]
MASNAAFVVLLLALWVTAQDCVTGPLSLPLGEVKLSNGYTQRGVSVKVGNPPQAFAFLPSWNHGNALVFDTRCGLGGAYKMPRATCITNRGGLYDQFKSDSKGKLASSVNLPADSWVEESHDIFTDTLHLGGNNSLRAFPLTTPKNEMASHGAQDQNALGVGTGSTLLDACRKAGLVASDSIGFSWGLDGVGESDRTSGSFVLGGYDKAKTIGNGRTGRLSHPVECPTRMMVSILDVVVNFPNGTDASVFPTSGGTLRACIIPERPIVMELPADPYFGNLLRAIENEVTGLDSGNAILNGSKPLFTADLTITMSGGFQVKIPNHQLLDPQKKIGINGETTVGSPLQPVLRLTSPQNSTTDFRAVLGRYFFTDTYVFLNRDADIFTLWQANHTSEEKLVSVNYKNEVVTATQTCATSPVASPGADSGKGRDGSLSSGAIAGIVVGAATAAGVGVGLLWWLLVRRRKGNAKVEMESAAAAEVQEMPQTSKVAEVGWPSQGQPHSIPQELPSEPIRTEPVELATGTEGR